MLKRLYHRYTFLKNEIERRKKGEDPEPPVMEVPQNVDAEKKNNDKPESSNVTSKPGRKFEGIFSDGPPKCESPLQRLQSLKAKKKSLQRILAEYQSDFVRDNGRPVKSSSDREPVRFEYEQYKVFLTC